MLNRVLNVLLLVYIFFSIGKIFKFKHHNRCVCVLGLCVQWIFKAFFDPYIHTFEADIHADTHTLTKLAEACVYFVVMTLVSFGKPQNSMCATKHNHLSIHSLHLIRLIIETENAWDFPSALAANVLICYRQF